MGTPHDSYVHATFRHPRQVAAWLRILLPPELVARLDWSTLRRVGERLQGRRLRVSAADLAFSVRFLDSPFRLLAGIEHRSFAGAGLRDTLLRYAVHLLHGSVRDDEGPAAVFAAAMYHGEGEPDLRSRMELAFPPEHRELLLPWQPGIRIAVDNLSACSETDILARPLLPRGTLTQLGVRFLPRLDPPGTLAALDRWGPVLRAVDADDRAVGEGDSIEDFGWYLLHVNDTPAEDVHMALEKNLQRHEGTFMSTAEKLRREGHAVGRLEGKLEGRLEGKTEGETEGRVATLLRQLTRRFGPLPGTVGERLQHASLAELDRIADRVLDAPTLGAVFAGE